MTTVEIADFSACTRDRFIEVSGAGGAARLAPSFLLAHEAGVRADRADTLTDRHWARIDFDLVGGRPQRALLLWFVDWVPGDGDPVPWHIAVNGTVFEHRQDPRAMLTGGWDRLEIPGRALRPGRNEVVFSGHGQLHFDAGPGGNSLRSFDGGRTWHANALGPERDAAGEYLVRLRVAGHPPAGTVTGAVVDLGDPAGAGRIVPRLRFGAVRLDAAVKVPAGTVIRFEMRTGASPAFDPAWWTPWQAGTQLRTPQRFVQWRAHLETSRLAASPVLTGVTLAADVAEDAVGREQYHLLEFERPELRRSSYPFVALAPHPRAERLVRQYRLDEVVAPGQTDFDRLKLLAEWVFSQWYGWQRERYPYCPSWDPIDILDTVKNNWGYGMCTHYGAALAGCAAALGYAIRCLILDHHCLTEVWVSELDQWIMLDAGLSNESYAVYELDGAPINALEAHRAVAAGRSADLRERLLPQDVVMPMRKGLLDIFCRFGIVLRNNHMVQAEPGEDRHGHQQYHWDGYLWWSDSADPRYPEFSLLTQREADLYWTVGKVRAHLQVVDALGHLEVRLEHTMPAFSHYEARRGRGGWERVEDRFEWALGMAANDLAVRAVSQFGRPGPATRLKVFRGTLPDGTGHAARPLGATWTRTG